MIETFAEREQRYRLLEICEDEIDRAGAEQQLEHRLAQRRDRDHQQRPALATGKFIGAVAEQTLRGFLGT